MPCCRLFLLAVLFSAGSVCSGAAPGESAAPELNEFLQARIKVVSQEGAPIAGAKVFPWALRSSQGHGTWSKDGQGRSEPTPVTTDMHGTATVTYPRFSNPEQRIAVTAVSCRIEHPDFADTVYNNFQVPTAGEPTIFEMAKGAQVTITPLGEDLSPVSSGVHVLWSDSSYWASKTRAASGELGKQVLPRLSAGSEVLRLVRIDGEKVTHFSAAFPLLLNNGDQLDLFEQLLPAIKVQGRLSDNVPRPVKHGRVSAAIVNRTLGEDHETIYWHTWAPVAEDGTFTIEGLPADDNLQLIALCDGFIASSGKTPDFADERERRATSFQLPQVFKLPASGEAEVVLEMEPTGKCEFVVKDQAGNPLRGIEVSAWPNVRWWNGGSQIYCTPLSRSIRFLQGAPMTELRMDEGKKLYPKLFTADTDENGRAVIADLKAGSSSYGVYEPHGTAHKLEEHRGKINCQAGKTISREVVMTPLRTKQD